MSVWEGKVPSSSNPAYAFNKQQDNSAEYAGAPYMPQLMGAAREAITDVLQEELHRKDQIKSLLVVNATYVKYKYKGSGDPADPTNFEASYLPTYHRGNMRAILSKNDIAKHITQSVGEIDGQIEKNMKEESGKILLRIESVFIESYTYRRAGGGSFIPTPKKLANSKCTINPDNHALIDPETNRPSEKCLQGALGAYFAYQDGHTEHLERIFRAKKLKPYLDIVKLDGIPMPTPICLRIFNKIEEMNPDISINIWEWKEETATPKPIVASKNFYISGSCKIENCKHPRPNECHEKRPHVIHLMALTDITKSVEEKYGQKNHFLWIKNANGLVFKDTAHHGEKHLCNRCFQSFPSEKSLVYHQEWCYGLDEAPQRVTMPVEGVNNFEEFKNYGRMINALCVIIADFESDNKKCDEKYDGSMHKIAEQRANSFCYLVHWIDTGDVWGLSYTKKKMLHRNLFEELMRN